MKPSARDVLPGRVAENAEGTVTRHMRMDGGGVTVTAAITGEAVAEPGPRPGETACAVVKASDVMVGQGE